MPIQEFDLHECPICEFTVIVPHNYPRTPCPLCWSDCLHINVMKFVRRANSDDRCEGRDWRTDPISGVF